MPATRTCPACRGPRAPRLFRPTALALLLAGGALLTVCCAKSVPSTASRLRSYLDTIRVVDAHEHQRWPPEYGDKNINFYTLLATSYLQADLVSAGAPELKPEDVTKGDLDALWKTYGRFFDYSRNTTYYSHFLAGFRLLYGLNDPAFTEGNVRTLSAAITANYGQKDAWYEKAFRQAGFDVMIVDQYWNAFNTELDPRYFAVAFNINPLVYSVSDRRSFTAKNAPADTNIYKLAESESPPILALDDYLAAAGRLLRSAKERHVVCLKNSLAYSRSLDFEDVPYETANALFAKPTESLSRADKKALQDFMFHWIIQRSIDLDLPIQIHTGYLAGNGNLLEKSRPALLNNLFLKYPKARFVIFHGGYPWTGETAALAKMFPNVALDLVWLPQISREAAVRGLDEMLDTVPYNKFFWGGDCHFIEESAGSLMFGKDVVAQVLAMRVERGLMTEDLAREIARRIFRDNALEYFKIKG
jgi:hypothetical protein